MNSFQPNSFTPGIGAQSSYGNQINSSPIGSLLPMLQQLLQRHLGVTNAGTNGYTLRPGSINVGGIDASGRYTPGISDIPSLT